MPPQITAFLSAKFIRFTIYAVADERDGANAGAFMRQSVPARRYDHERPSGLASRYT